MVTLFMNGLLFIGFLSPLGKGEDICRDHNTLIKNMTIGSLNFKIYKQDFYIGHKPIIGEYNGNTFKLICHVCINMITANVSLYEDTTQLVTTLVTPDLAQFGENWVYSRYVYSEIVYSSSKTYKCKTYYGKTEIRVIDLTPPLDILEINQVTIGFINFVIFVIVVVFSSLIYLWCKLKHKPKSIIVNS